MTSYLDELEAESIFIIREAACQFKKPALLFSGGKDSITLATLAAKAFYPLTIPFPLLHIDTGHNFSEVLAFRDEFIKKLNAPLIIRKVEDTMHLHGISAPQDKLGSRNAIQTHTLLDTIREFGFDACFGGARRDEEKARAKERVFSGRNINGGWDPALQRPELWNIYNGKINDRENVRIFPLSNWTELDIWNYIQREQISLPSIYFSHNRDCIQLNGQLVSRSKHLRLDESDIIVNKPVRFRTVGDMNCTAAIESKANSVDEILVELKHTLLSERGASRLDDKVSDSAMEDRKRGGYF